MSVFFADCFVTHTINLWVGAQARLATGLSCLHMLQKILPLQTYENIFGWLTKLDNRELFHPKKFSREKSAIVPKTINS